MTIYKKLTPWVFSCFLALIISSCIDDVSPSSQINPVRSGGTNDTTGTGGSVNDTTIKASQLIQSNWIVPSDQVLDGGPGPDGIPALLNPPFTEKSEADYLSDDKLVVGVKFGNDIRAYPHDILDWHEIANDNVGGKGISLTYCPLTGTAIGWDTEVNGELTTFGVSGLLYNSNLMPYDRRTGAVWSQMLLRKVSGPDAGKAIKTFQVVETTWATWKKMYPGTKVVDVNTGFRRSYGRYPYGDFRESSRLIFPVSKTDTRVFQKERVHGIISGDEVTVYRFKDFVEDRLITDNIVGKEVVVIGSRENNYFASFYTEPNASFNIVNDDNRPSVVMKDNNNNFYNIFGEVISGPNTGMNLEPTVSFMSYWFAFPAFYGQINIYSGNP